MAAEQDTELMCMWKNDSHTDYMLYTDSKEWSRKRRCIQLQVRVNLLSQFCSSDLSEQSGSPSQRL